jgi:hypothetical protein
MFGEVWVSSLERFDFVSSGERASSPKPPPFSTAAILSFLLGVQYYVKLSAFSSDKTPPWPESSIAFRLA